MTTVSEGRQRNEVSYDRPVDCDNHYYEKIDAFTRYLDPKYRQRGVEIITRGTHTELLAGGNLFEFVPNPTFDPVIVPGCLDALFRGEIPEGVDPRSLSKVEPLNPAYQDRDLRLEMIEKQQMSGVILLPTLACGVEEALKHDIPATMASITAFNKWLDEDWGYAYQGRIFATPMLSFADPDEAIGEIDRLIERDVRIVSVRPAPIPAGHGTSNAFGDPRYDEVWTKLEKSGIAVAFHLSDSGYTEFLGAAWGGPPKFAPFRYNDPLASLVVSDRAIHDTIASLVIGGVFTRHPKLRVASIENGSDFVHLLLKRLRKLANQAPWLFAEDPGDTLCRHLWVSPYYEDDVPELVEVMGSERVMFGSDWPHGEGLETPLDFIHELEGFGTAEIDQIMRTNVLDLMGVDYAR
ncbi:amidohydrolase family protein [Williamsia sp.]|uniref:amidohydrolase family protein n=1 Tax=Williamsia sp. TaxID=1872085 RepID=UPI002F922121